MLILSVRKVALMPVIDAALSWQDLVWVRTIRAKRKFSIQR